MRIFVIFDLLFFFIFIDSFAIVPLEVRAATCTPGQFCNPLGSDSFEALVQSLANWVAVIALPIVAIFIIYAGFLFVTAGGNQSKIDAAKTTFYWTIIGAAIVVGAWALAAAIVNFAKGL